MLNYKSILYKERYYPISYKLKFILSSNLNISHTRTIHTTHIIFRSKFLFDKLVVYKSNAMYYHDNNCLDKTTKYPQVNLSRTSEYYLRDNQLHRDNKPAYIEYDNNKVTIIAYYQFGEMHNCNGPAFVRYDKDGSIRNQLYYYKGRETRKNDIVLQRIIDNI